jgi:hypothetical protein
VARSAQGQAANETQGEAPAQPAVTEAGEKMPTDKILDVSPLALRMSSPFNAGYWLAAA